jgi:hypothetical protein
MFQIFLGSIIAGLHFLWQIPLILLALIGFPKFIISDAQIIDIALKKIDKSDVLSSQQRWHQGSIKNDGLIFSWKLGIIAYLYEKTEGNRVVSELALITTKKNFNELIANPNETDNKSSIENHESRKVRLLVADGNAFNSYYNDDRFVLKEDENNPNQAKIISDILDFYKKNNSCSVFISGPPGTGKSTIASLLALKLNAVLCESFDPTLQGYTLEKLKIRANPTKDQPLIILFDEVDEMIGEVHRGIPRAKLVPIWVRNKRTTTTFLSNMNRHKHVILIMTSNFSKQQISKKFHPCYLRDGRVDVSATLMKKE